MAKVFLSEFIAEDLSKKLEEQSQLRDWIIYAAKLGWKVHFEGFDFGLGITISTGPKHNYQTHSRVVSWHDVALGKREAISASLELQIRSLEKYLAGVYQGEGI